MGFFVAGHCVYGARGGISVYINELHFEVAVNALLVMLSHMHTPKEWVNLLPATRIYFKY